MLRPSPRCGSLASLDEYDGAGERCRVHQHLQDPLEVELAMHQSADGDPVHDANRGDLGSGRHAFDDDGADDERQRQCPQRHQQRLGVDDVLQNTEQTDVYYLRGWSR
jgi:hypothetical protein